MKKTYVSMGKIRKREKTISQMDNSGVIGTEGEVNTITESTIKDVFEISELQDAVVNAGKLEYIFKKDKYNNENVFKESYAKCQEDLDKRAGSEDKLLTMAKENADQVIEALVQSALHRMISAKASRMIRVCLQMRRIGPKN